MSLIDLKDPRDLVIGRIEMLMATRPCLQCFGDGYFRVARVVHNKEKKTPIPCSCCGGSGRVYKKSMPIPDTTIRNTTNG